ncbi:MAG: DUF1963 domain-containing protein [Alphaproteobacteria bacterium]|nr:DUF1963 domain-containing protein [Alphaproteobacteria bacterium]MCW5739826.1 DUF1963 domain-containing protein [Alphaproteobacteria bacterium]
MASSEETPSDEQPRVTESVSVVLRRQVPPRSEAPRSWLGGLPMMPAHVAWPRSISTEYPERGERPLHFMAQIACADLPAELWGGLGPRHGWLLLFIDPNHFEPLGPDALRVMHIRTLGPERAAPDDLGPMDDGQHSSTDYDYYRSPADIPSTWRRWPVDLVVVANDESDGLDRMMSAPSELEMFLHKGQIIAHGAPREPEPFTWRGALYVLNTLESRLGKHPRRPNLTDSILSRLRRPGYIGTILLEFDERFAEWFDAHRALLEGPEPPGGDAREHRNSLLVAAEDIKARRAALAEFLERNPTPDAIIEHLRENRWRFLAWQESARERVAHERSSVLAHDLDTPMPGAVWQALKDRLRRDTFSFWTTDKIRKGNDYGYVTLVEAYAAAYDDTGFGFSTGIFQLIADYYVDARLRKLIPPSVLSMFEPYWRCLVNNQPHRMGGYQDGIQSHAPVGPTRQLLLFQIASDGAMNWWWADVGAYYVYIDVKDMKVGAFSKAWLEIETH